MPIEVPSDLPSNRSSDGPKDRLRKEPETSPRRGLMLLNLGTPDQPHPEFVAKYLREFLMDPLVLDINGFFRWVLVNGIIVPKRSKSSAAAYQKVWTDRGSPLMFHLLDLVDQVKKLLGDRWVVKP